MHTGAALGLLTNMIATKMAMQNRGLGMRPRTMMTTPVAAAGKKMTPYRGSYGYPITGYSAYPYSYPYAYPYPGRYYG